MAKNTGLGRNDRRDAVAALEDTDPMTREELLEAFGRSGLEPGRSGQGHWHPRPEPASRGPVRS